MSTTFNTKNTSLFKITNFQINQEINIKTLDDKYLSYNPINNIVEFVINDDNTNKQKWIIEKEQKFFFIKSVFQNPNSNSNEYLGVINSNNEVCLNSSKNQYTRWFIKQIQNNIFSICFIGEKIDNNKQYNMDYNIQYYTKNKIISYDLFDTLIFRYCNEPYHIFDIIEKKINNPNFKNHRMNSEYVVYNTIRNGNIDDIYNKMGELYNYDNNILEYYKSVEIDTEIDNIYPNNELFIKLKEIDIIVSDMYLLEEHLRKILWKCYNYNKNISFDFADKLPNINIDKIKIYVSSGGKHNGWIWDKIIEKSKIFYHIGDNYQSDFVKAKEYGINSIHYKGTPYSDYEIILKDSSNLDLANFSRYIRLMNIYSPGTDEYILFNLSANINIPVLLLVCNFLNSIDKKILFSLRDCYYLKIFYDLLYDDKYESKYLFCSRLCFKNADQEYVDYYNSMVDNNTILFDIQATGLTLNTFLEKFNLSNIINLYTIASHKKSYDNLKPLSIYDDYHIVECLNANNINSFVKLNNKIFINLINEYNKNIINLILNTINIAIKYLLKNNIQINYCENLINKIYYKKNFNNLLLKKLPPITHENKNFIEYKYCVNFIIFNTQGQPYDNGLNIEKQGKMFENLYTPFFDSFTRYTPKKCMEIDPEFIDKIMTVYPQYNYGEHSRGNKHGFWRWKAFIIKHHLGKLTNGEILIYQDSNCIRYPFFLEYLNEYRNNVEEIFENIDSDIIVPLENPYTLKCKHHVKKEIFETIGENTDYYREFPLLNANRIFIRKTDLSVKFIDEWFDYCMRDLILPESTLEPELRWSTHDQAILSVLYRKYIKEGLFKNKGVFIKYRIFSKKNIFYVNSLPGTS
jgi:predicted HAD superfamily hydrolase